MSMSSQASADLAVLSLSTLLFVQAMAADNSDKWFAAHKKKKATA